MAAPERNTTADRVPPHDTEAEQCVLGCCLLDDEAALRALEIVTPFDFYRDAHRTVMAAVQVVNSRREPVDLATVAAELRRTGQLENVGGAEYLTAVVNKVPTAAHVIRYATIVAEKSLLRRMITEAAAIQDAAYSNPANVGNALNDAASRITRIMDERLSERVGIQPMAARASGLVALAEEAGRGRKPLSAARLGISEVDEVLGPIGNRGLIVLKADSGVGKTQLAVNAVYSTAEELLLANDRRRVIVFSFEAPGIYDLRGLSWATMVDSALIDRGFDGGKHREQWQQLQSAARTMREWPIDILDGEADENAVEMHLRKWARKETPALVVIDYWQEMQRRSAGRQSDREQLEASAYRWKGIAKEFGCPFLVLSQVTFNRDTGKTEAMGSRKIEQAADLALLLSYDEKTGTQWLTGTKTRYGVGIGKRQIKLDLRYSRAWGWEEYQELERLQQMAGGSGAWPNND